MKVRSMRVRARAGQRRMVARHKWHRALDDFAAGVAQAFSEALRAQDATRQFIDGMLCEWIRPIVAEVVNAAQPNGAVIGGSTSSGGGRDELELADAVCWGKPSIEVPSPARKCHCVNFDKQEGWV